MSCNTAQNGETPQCVVHLYVPPPLQKNSELALRYRDASVVYAQRPSLLAVAQFGVASPNAQNVIGMGVP